MIVVDANIIVYFLTEGEKNAATERLFAVDSEWIAPRLWLDEFVNVLCTCERAGKMSSSSAEEVLKKALTLMSGATYTITPGQILAVSRRTGCSGYDSQYIALAENLAAPLYTFDKKILQSCPDLARCPE
ncbi:MAG: type II toxin-antitoxin system VapC family toxin [Verrucomicrobiales bacterium]|jgi:predicted nucleic acid-binding protein|nr:type II toxin-antitoxin system VapC family toxin [Verrucomicrobiales bacterium]